MSHASPHGSQLLNGFKHLPLFEKGMGAQLPEAYKKFWHEWKIAKPAAVHFIPKEVQWERDDVTGEITPVQIIPLPLMDTPQLPEDLWGDEVTVHSFQSRRPLRRRMSQLMAPTQRSVVHSMVLNEHVSMVVSDRTVEKMKECQGFDHFLLKNPACDLRSAFALKLKRYILLELLHGCPRHAENEKEQQRILKEYKCYLKSYTPEEIDWYGYTFSEAIRKLTEQLEQRSAPQKIEFRMRLIEQLKQAGIREAGGSCKNSKISEGDMEALAKIESSSSSSSNWLAKINPFGRKQET